MAAEDVRTTVDPQSHEAESEVQGSEVLQSQNVLGHGLLFANDKRTYDAYQQRDFVELDRGQVGFDADRELFRRHAEDLHDQRMRFAEDLHTARMRSFNNSIESDNMVAKRTMARFDQTDETSEMVGKRAIDAHDLGIDQWWNAEVQEGVAEGHLVRTATLDEASLKAIGAAVAAALAAEINKKA